MEITLATKEDIEGIIPLQAQIYRVDSKPQNAQKTLEDLIDADYCDVLVARLPAPERSDGGQAKDEGKVVGSGLIFYLKNPGHEKPFAYLEGVVVDDKARGKGIGTALSKFAITLAKKKDCYKILFTSGYNREKIHKFYENLGFVKWGLEFRMDL